MAKTTVPGLYIADSAITAAKLNSTLDLTGKTITVATASSGDNDTTIASTAFVQQEIAALVDSSPSALNTLNELAAAIGDDANFSTTVTNSIATKLPLAGGTMTGNLIINTTGSIQIPVGTTAQRPTAAQGQLRFNTTTSKPEIYNGSAWADVGGGVESVNSATGAVTLDTDDISEGSSNLYFTNARADARIAAADTDSLSEGSSNLYFTTARANSAIDGRLSGSTGVTVSNGAISIGQDVATSTSPTFQNLTLSGTDSIKVPSGTTAQRSGSPANGMLRYNSSTNEFEGYADSAWGAIGGDTTSSVDLYTATGNGSTATYDTGKNPQSENTTWVFIGGVYQPKSTYSFSGTEITLSENLPSGEDLEVITGTVSTYNPTDAILGQYNTTTSNTASYDTSLTTENENNVFVFIDGVYQPKSSYTYSGSTLTLDATPTSGMSLEVLVTRSMNAATVTTGFLADDAVTTAKITDANVTAAKLASSLDLTGKTVTVATASAGDNDTSVASTAFVRQEITSLVDSAPAAMDTLNELAAALGDDANFSTTVNASIAAKLPLAGGTMTGNITLGDNNKAIFGAGSDLQIYHDGTDNHIISGTSNLNIQCVGGGNINLGDQFGNTLLQVNDNADVKLFYGTTPSEKLATTSTGIDVTGTVVADGLTVENTSGATLDINTNLAGADSKILLHEGTSASPANGASIRYDGVNNLFKIGVGSSVDTTRLTIARDTGIVSLSAGIDVDGTIKLDGNYPSGTNNVALGNTALDSLTTGGNNTAIGRDVLTAATEGNHNTAVGSAAMESLTTGSFNIGLGTSALGSTTTGESNVGLGYQALVSNTTANDNTAVGVSAMYANTTGVNGVAVGRSALQNNTTGNNNVALGYAALNANTTGAENVAIGKGALDANTTASSNVGIGNNALGANTSGAQNVAIGSGALDAVTTQSFNTAVGHNTMSACTESYQSAFGHSALAALTTGTRNNAFGAFSLDACTTGTNNTAMGYDALTATTTGSYNVAIGSEALKSNTTGSFNVGLGVAALDANTTGTYNVGIGHDSLGANTTGSENTSVGFYCMRLNTTGTRNIAMGYNTLAGNTSGNNNTALGHNAMASNTTGSDNVAVGRIALDSNTTGHSNVSIGESSLTSNTTGYRNTAIGQNALAVNSTGYENTAIGRAALDANSTGYANVAIGDSAMTASTTGSLNVAVGALAGDGITSGGNNVIMGYNAGSTIDVGSGNTCIGRDAGMAIEGSNGKWNTAVGYNALRSNHAQFQSTAVGQNCLTVSTAHGATAYGSNACASQTTGESNQGFGYFTLNSVTTGDNNSGYGTVALRYVTTGDGNVGFGANAGGTITIGSNNTCIGYNAGNNIQNGVQNIVIGQSSVTANSTHSNTIVIGSTTTGKGANTGFINPNSGGVYQGNNSSTWSQTSDRRIKKNIEDNTTGLNAINQIRVRNFEYRTEDEITDFDNPASAVVKKEGVQLGVIAQEIEEILPDVVTDEATGVKSVNADNLTWYLVNAVKQLSTEVNELKKELKVLKGE